eukprot:1996683-Rhodomonas_salina.1
MADGNLLWNGCENVRVGQGNGTNYGNTRLVSHATPVRVNGFFLLSAERGQHLAHPAVSSVGARVCAGRVAVLLAVGGPGLRCEGAVRNADKRPGAPRAQRHRVRHHVRHVPLWLRSTCSPR